MDPTVISIGGMVLTAALAYMGAQRGIAAQLAKLETKVDTLSARVEKHNGVIERLAVLTERVDELSKRIQTIEGEMR